MLHKQYGTNTDFRKENSKNSIWVVNKFYSGRQFNLSLNLITSKALNVFVVPVGKSSTHAVVLAQLVISNQNHGMHAFIVQLRSLDDHMPLPGEYCKVPKFWDTLNIQTL